MDSKRSRANVGAKGRNSNSINLPRRNGASSPKGDGTAQSSESSAEKVLCDVLFAAKASVLKGAAIKDSAYELERILPFLPQRSRESVEQEVSKIIVKLIELRGPSPQHRMVAYANVAEQMFAELDGMIFNTDTKKLQDLEKRYDELKKEKDVLHTELSQEIAAKDIEIARLADEQIDMDEKLQAMAEANTGLQLEIEKLLRDRIQTHQNSVELRMQGLDFKAEVDRRGGSILSSVQARMGFVPVGIEKQIELLRALKAPGDPSYDQVRQFRAMKVPTVDAESYISGLGSGSEVSTGSKSKSPRSSPYLGSPRSRPSPNGFTPQTRSADTDWAVRVAAGSPAVSSDGDSSRKDRPNSAPARRQSQSPRENVSTHIMKAGSPIVADRELNCVEGVAAPSPPMLSPVSTAEKRKSATPSPSTTDSASIVRKLRIRNPDSRDVSSKAISSPLSNSGVTFNTTTGQVVKMGSPVRGTVEVKSLFKDGPGVMYSPRLDTDNKKEYRVASVSIPTAALRENEMPDDISGSSSTDMQKDFNFRERRSSSGATSTGLSSGGLP